MQFRNFSQCAGARWWPREEPVHNSAETQSVIVQVRTSRIGFITEYRLSTTASHPLSKATSTAVIISTQTPLYTCESSSHWINELESWTSSASALGATCPWSCLYTLRNVRISQLYTWRYLIKVHCMTLHCVPQEVYGLSDTWWTWALSWTLPL